MKSKKILVTGASRGIGQAIAIQLAKDGYTLLLHARTEDNLAQTIAKMISNASFQIITADFLKIEEVKSFLSILKKEHKDLFGIISNAGITFDKPIAYQPEQQIDSILQVNLKVPILLGKLAMKLFLKNKNGVFINMSSVVGETGNAYQSVYAATKAGVVALSKSWAKEIGELLEEHQVRFLSVSPGLLMTTSAAGITNIRAMRKKSKSAAPLGNIKLEDVTEAAMYYFSDASKRICGNIHYIDGGLNIMSID